MTATPVIAMLFEPPAPPPPAEAALSAVSAVSVAIAITNLQVRY
jgi:hypothetical protein